MMTNIFQQMLDGVVKFAKQEKLFQFNDNFFYFVHQYEAIPKKRK